MAKALNSVLPGSEAVSQAPSLRSVAVSRLVLGLAVITGAFITVDGVSWDIQWHDFVGRDRTLIPPHEMMLGGILLSGLAALTAVLLETLWTRRNSRLAKYSTGFAGFFNSSLGAYVAGFGALAAAIGFPLDAYWHALYGIDVGIWAPFHIMILTGVGLIALGGAYMLISTSHLAERLGNRGMKRAGYVAVIIAVATMLVMLTYMLPDAIDDQHFVTIGGVSVTVFPLLSGLLVATTFVAVIRALPWRFAATFVALGYIAYGLLFMAYVPRLTDYLVTLEHLTYRQNIAQNNLAGLTVVTMIALFVMPIIVAPLLDLCARRARQKNWSRRRTFLTMVVLSLPACLPVTVLRPTSSLLIADFIGVSGTVASLLLGLLGISLGVWFGERLGATMQQVERGA